MATSTLVGLPILKDAFVGKIQPGILQVFHLLSVFMPK